MNYRNGGEPPCSDKISRHIKGNSGQGGNEQFLDETKRFRHSTGLTKIDESPERKCCHWCNYGQDALSESGRPGMISPCDEAEDNAEFQQRSQCKIEVQKDLLHTKKKSRLQVITVREIPISTITSAAAHAQRHEFTRKPADQLTFTLKHASNGYPRLAPALQRTNKS